MVERGTCGFSFVNRTQQRVRGLPTSSSWYVCLCAKAVYLIQKVNDKIHEIKLELTKESTVDAQGAILHAKARWVSEAEHNSKYFFALEKRQAKNKQMSATIVDGKINRNQGKILQAQQEYFSKLYRSNVNVESKMNCKPDRELDEHTKTGLDKEITMDEIQIAIKSMARNKSPGLSGLSVDIYIVFWQRLKQPFYEMVQEVYKQGIFYEGAQNGIITLLPKPERDLLFLKNWRPIILLETVYKVISKVITNRIKGTLSTLINEDQTGFVKGRQISENIRKLLDVIDITDRDDIAGLLLSIDFSKAFDNVEFVAVRNILRWLNFGEYIIKWVDVLFKDFKFMTLSNRYFSNQIKVEKGLFQGNPVAPYLFVLVIELLATKLRRNKNIKCIKIGQEEFLLTLFADDLGIFLDVDQKTWYETFQELELFKRDTGMVINYDKITVHRLGSAKKANAKLYSHNHIRWSNKPFKMLGIMICDNKEDLFELNYDPVIKNIESILCRWAHHNLSLLGKVLLANTLIVSLLIYKFMVISQTPEKYLKRIEQLINTFIWKGGKSKLPAKIMRGLKCDGGAGLFDIQKKEWSVKIQWVYKLQKETVITEMSKLLLKELKGVEIHNTSLNEADCDRLFKTESFWKDVMKLRAKLISLEEVKNIKEQPLWFNSNVRIRNDPIYWE